MTQICSLTGAFTRRTYVRSSHMTTSMLYRPRTTAAATVVVHRLRGIHMSSRRAAGYLTAQHITNAATSTTHVPRV